MNYESIELSASGLGLPWWGRQESNLHPLNAHCPRPGFLSSQIGSASYLMYSHFKAKKSCKNYLN